MTTGRQQVPLKTVASIRKREVVSVKEQLEQQERLLIEMAHMFSLLEGIDGEWPESIRQHCDLWCALMAVELPAGQEDTYFNDER